MRQMGTTLTFVFFIVGCAIAFGVDAAWVLRLTTHGSELKEISFAPAQIVWQADAELGRGAFVGFFYTALCLAGLIACLLVFALCTSRLSSRYAFDLAAALTAGSLAIAWGYLISIYDEYGVSRRIDQPWVKIIDIASVGLFACATAWFARFIARYPTEATMLASEEIYGAIPPARWAQRGAIRIYLSWPATHARAWIRKVLVQLARLCHALEFPQTARWFLRGALFLRAGEKVFRGERLSERDRIVLQRHSGERLFGSTWFVPAMAAIGIGTGVAWRYPLPRGLGVLLGFVLPVLAFTNIVFMAPLSMYYKYKHGLPDHRRQIEWMVWGTLLGVVLLLVSTVGVDLGLGGASFLGWVTPGKAMAWEVSELAFTELGCVLMFMAMLIGIVFSVFYHGAVSPGLAIRRTTVYSLLTLLMTTVFVAVEGAVSSQIVLHLDLPSSTAPVAAGTVVALAFVPVRKRVEAGVERLMDRIRPAELLAQGQARNVAVMFSDISGYTALSETDQTTALTLASLFHKTAREAAESHSGALVKTIGDAVMLAFPNCEAAAAGALTLHRKFAAGSRALQLTALELHSGIHQGVAIQGTDGDLYGTTVNLAARLQGLAKPGEIVVSDPVAQVLASAPTKLEPLGAHQLKNVAKPVVCWRLLTS